ncbi:MAG: sialidase family protein, partial [Acidimicrobiia bacterium]
WVRVSLGVAAGVMAAVLIVGPVLWLRGTSGGGSEVAPGQSTPTTQSTVAMQSTAATPVSGVDPGTTAAMIDNPAGISFGEPAVVTTATAGPGELRAVLSVGNVLYASMVGPTDRVVRSVDDGSTWETVLEADPGDGEGLFAAGEVVVLVIEDDNPARNTMAPSSVVTEAPRVLVFDPATGATTETVLPRPEDPAMQGLSEDEGADRCGTFGYQSWVHAVAVAVGDRLVVIGSHQLVGRLADGTVICFGQVSQRLIWTSDDRGRSWELHDGPRLGAVTWTGTRFVAWWKADTTSYSDGSPDGLVVSTDGVDWTTAVSSPPIPDGSIIVGTSVLSVGDTVIAWAGIRGWAAEVPDNVTDPEQLREVLRIANDMDVEQTLEMLGVDLPLDPDEVEIIARFNGSTRPTGAIIAVSNDGGLAWTATRISEPVTGVVGIVETTYISLTSSFGNPSDPNDDSSSLLTSTDGVNWTHAVDLPELGYVRFFTTTEDAIYLGGGQTGELWRIPVNR